MACAFAHAESVAGTAANQPDDSEEFIMDPANVEARLQAVLPTDRPYEVVHKTAIVCMSVWSTNIWTAAYSLPAMRHI